MRKCFSVVFIALLLAAAAVGAQDVCVRDTFFPDAGNCGYDVENYRLDMVWNIEGDRWAVDEVITFVSEWDTDELWFDFNDKLEITALAVDGQDVSYDRQDTKLIVYYSFAHDTAYELSASFSGKLQWGELFDPDGESRDPANGFCMLNEPTNAWRFYICNDHPKDKATYHYSFTVPANYVPAGSGRLQRIVEADGTVIIPGESCERSWDPEAGEGTVTFTYIQNAPSAPYLFTVCAGAYDMKLRTLDDGKVQLDFVDRNHPDTQGAWELTEIQEEMIGVLSEFFGDYPYEDLGAIISNTYLGAALETQGRSLYDASTTEEYIFAHEITHQWLGDLVSLEDWSDIWFKEGAASFGEALWTEHTDGRKAYEAYMRRYYEVAALGNFSNYRLTDSFLSSLAKWNDNSEDMLFDHDAAVKAIASFCFVPSDEVQLIDGNVTFAEWVSGLRETCDVITCGEWTMIPYFEMLGISTDGMKKTAAGPKEISCEITDIYSTSSYQGASIVFYALREHLGDEVFSRALQTLIEENKYGTVNTEKFIEVFCRVSGEDLTEFINSYLYYADAGHIPDLPGIETWDELAAKYMIE